MKEPDVTRELLHASCRDGSSAYDAEIEWGEDLGRRTLTYRIVPPGGSLRDDFFSARLEQVAEGVWQVSAIVANRADLRGRGLMPAVLLDARTRTGGVVRSSSNQPAHKCLHAERRTASATASWVRMVERGDARSVPEEDRFYVT